MEPTTEPADPGRALRVTPGERANDRQVSRRGLVKVLGSGVAGLAVGVAVRPWLGEQLGTGSAPAAVAPPEAESTSGAAIYDVTSYGARGDGYTDDTDAIRAALARLRPGDTLSFPGGRNFLHGHVLALRTPGTRLTGPGRLTATSEERSAVRVEADDVVLDGQLVLSVATTSRRWEGPDQHKIYLGPVRGVVVRDVMVDGSAAAGIFCEGTREFLLERAVVRATRADGIHMTGGARNGLLRSPHVIASGDDGVAIVSYARDAAVSQGIEVISPRVSGTTWGRGLSVVGGQDVVFTDIDVTGSSAAALYIACEGDPWFTRPSERIAVRRGSVTGANSNKDVDHGAVLVYCGRTDGSVRDVAISGLSIRETRPDSSRQVGVVGTAGDLSEIRLDDFRVSSKPEPFATNLPPGRSWATRWVVDGAVAVTAG